MHRTLFTPSMIETFRSCKRAYELAFLKYTSGSGKTTASVICKKFVLRALAEINRDRLTTVNQVQKYMGQNWPVEKLNEQIGEKEVGIRAFLFAYKSLIKYVTAPYRPRGAEVMAVALKARARIAHVRVYVEDTLDLVLWYPQERRLEIVDFQLQPLKPFNPAWPSESLLVKYYLAERLKTRWPFEKLSLTQFRVGTQDFQPVTVNLEESIFRLHWNELIATLDSMKETKAVSSESCPNNAKGTCSHCQALIAGGESAAKVASFRLSA